MAIDKAGQSYWDSLWASTTRRPSGGFLFTSIPNMAGAVGPLQKRFSRAVYDKHVPIERARLAKSHMNGGLRVLRCKYFMPVDFRVVNIGAHSPTYMLRRLCLALLTRMSRLVLALEALGVRIPTTATLAPYINCLARKPPEFTPVQR